MPWRAACYTTSSVGPKFSGPLSKGCAWFQLNETRTDSTPERAILDHSLLRARLGACLADRSQVMPKNPYGTRRLASAPAGSTSATERAARTTTDGRTLTPTHDSSRDFARSPPVVTEAIPTGGRSS